VPAHRCNPAQSAGVIRRISGIIEWGLPDAHRLQFRIRIVAPSERRGARPRIQFRRGASIALLALSTSRRGSPCLVVPKMIASSAGLSHAVRSPPSRIGAFTFSDSMARLLIAAHNRGAFSMTPRLPHGDFRIPNSLSCGVSQSLEAQEVEAAHLYGHVRSSSAGRCTGCRSCR